ncbi:hypothetical protein MMC14_004800 [Varicellaria rhodocarpa]|nr:hypothetical protein [Varicellaria rhodocarpa]
MAANNDVRGISTASYSCVKRLHWTPIGIAHFRNFIAQNNLLSYYKGMDIAPLRSALESEHNQLLTVKNMDEKIHRKLKAMVKASRDTEQASRNEERELAIVLPSQRKTCPVATELRKGKTDAGRLHIEGEDRIVLRPNSTVMEHTRLSLNSTP